MARVDIIPLSDGQSLADLLVDLRRRGVKDLTKVKMRMDDGPVNPRWNKPTSENIRLEWPSK